MPDPSPRARLLRDSAASRRLWRGLLLMGLLAVAALAFGPRVQPLAAAGMDKLHHVAAFAALALAAALSAAPGARTTAAAGGGLLLYGVFIELVQSFIPGRSADPADVLADALGIVLGLGLARLLRGAPAD